MKRVYITVRAEQCFEGETVYTQSKAVGTMEHTEDGWTLCYAEAESSGLGKTQSVLRIGENRVELTRSGGVESVMLFTPGQTHRSLYKTPQGEISLAVTTESLRERFSERGGVIELRYTIAMNGLACGENRLRVLAWE